MTHSQKSHQTTAAFMIAVVIAVNTLHSITHISKVTQTLTRGNFLGAFAKLRKATIGFICPSVRPSVRMEQLGSHWTDFHEIWYLIFSKICWEN